VRDAADAKLTWRRAAVDAAEARSDEADAAVDLRRAELEWQRLQALVDAGKADHYTQSVFMQQLADARGDWEKARARADRLAADAEEAHRMWQRMNAPRRARVAYVHLGQIMAGAHPLSPRGALIASYALCGFANFASVGIQLGGIGGMAPNRMGDLAELGLRAMLGGSLATFMTACVAGMMM
jgi:hypothetical protein